MKQKVDGWMDHLVFDRGSNIERALVSVTFLCEFGWSLLLCWLTCLYGDLKITFSRVYVIKLDRGYRMVLTEAPSNTGEHESVGGFQTVRSHS